MREPKQANELLMRVCELLDDHEWHDYESVVRELGKLIPPGVAIRRNELDRSQQSEGRPRHMRTSEERQIQSGKRGITRDAMRSRYFERKSDGARVMVRLVRLPDSVARSRARQARETFDPRRVCDELARGALDHRVMSALTIVQLRALARELAERARAASSES